MEKKYTVSQVANGYVIIPGSKRSINGKDLNVFNEFRDMVCYLEKKFNIYSAESYSVELANKYLHEQAERMADEITEEDYEKLRKAKENYDWEDEKIYKLNLSTRTHNGLQMYGIDTIREINEKTDFQLYRIRNIGRKSVSEMREKIEQFRIKMEEE